MAKGSLEQLRGPHLRAPLRTQIGNTNPWAGRTTLNSGSTSVTVSTTRVNSDSIILYGIQVGSAAAAAQSGGMLCVNSVLDSISFALAWANGTAIPWDTKVMWTLIKTGG